MNEKLEHIALKAMLKYVEFEAFTHCCPVCGGNEYHDSACVLAAFLYPEKAESYKQNTGDTHINEMTFKIENDERFEFLRDELYNVPGYCNGTLDGIINHPDNHGYGTVADKINELDLSNSPDA